MPFCAACVSPSALSSCAGSPARRVGSPIRFAGEDRHAWSATRNIQGCRFVPSDQGIRRCSEFICSGYLIVVEVEGAQCCQEPGAVCWRVTQCGQVWRGFRLVIFLFIAPARPSIYAHAGRSVCDTRTPDHDPENNQIRNNVALTTVPLSACCNKNENPCRTLMHVTCNPGCGPRGLSSY